MSNIHPTAIVDPKAKIEKGVTIGPMCVVGPEVKIGKGTELKSHVVVAGRTTIGENNTIFPFVSLGQPPQDLKYNGEDTALVIGNGNSIREYVTMHLGTIQDESVTKVGDGNLFMSYVHVAHDCVVGNGCVLANGATLGGHVQVGDGSIIGGLSAIHQFVKIGRNVMIGGHSAVIRDVPPFVSAVGNRATLEGLNLVGLRRRGFEKKAIRGLRDAFDMIFLGDEGSLLERADVAAQEFSEVEEVIEMANFCHESSRGICMKGDRFTSDENS